MVAVRKEKEREAAHRPRRMEVETNLLWTSAGVTATLHDTELLQKRSFDWSTCKIFEKTMEDEIFWWWEMSTTLSKSQRLSIFNVLMWKRTL